MMCESMQWQVSQYSSRQVNTAVGKSILLEGQYTLGIPVATMGRSMVLLLTSLHVSALDIFTCFLPHVLPLC